MNHLPKEYEPYKHLPPDERKLIDEEAAEMGKKTAVFAAKRAASAYVGPVGLAIKFWQWLRGI